MATVNPEVTKFIEDLHHPLRAEIEALRLMILNANESLHENIKWNGPNYYFEKEDRITMRVHPPKQIQLIFHRGVRKLIQPDHKIINDTSGLLSWKENDRAIASFKNIEEIQKSRSALADIVNKWISATK